MRSIVTIGVGAAVLLAAGAASAAPVLEIKRAAARVVVIPEARSDVKVEMITVNQALPLTVHNEGDRVVVDGGLHHRVAGCRSMFGKVAVRVLGVGLVSYDALPQIVARVPMDARVEAGRAVFGSVARSDSLELSNAGCGDWTVGNVKGLLRVNVAGSGDTRAGAVGELAVRTAGSGDVNARQVGGGVSADIAGSGDVNAESMSGPLKANIAGSGDVNIASGHATEVTAHIAGSGDVRLGGTADSVIASIAGSGDVDVDRVTGPVKKSVLGSGQVNIGRP